MEKIDLEVDDFINYCDYKNLSVKTMSSYEQTLRLFIRYLQEECEITSTGQVRTPIASALLALFISV